MRFEKYKQHSAYLNNLIVSFSDRLPMKPGVPQGTKLGPILFLGMINNLNLGPSGTELKQATFLSIRTAAGSKLSRYRWRMMASAVLV